MMKNTILGILAGSLIFAVPIPAATARRHAWPAETLSGKIVMVEPARNLVVMEDAAGVPFDMVVTRTTRIQSGEQKLTLRDLSGKANREISVRFVPERKGNVAQSIRLLG